jgi:hypothetical protein
MEKHFSKRRLIPVAAALLALVCASGVVYAYWTAGGSGSGYGTTAAGVTNLTVDQVAPALTEMYPGDSAQTTHVTVTNGSAQSVHVTTVSISNVTTDKTGCGAADFSVGAAVTPWGAGGTDIAAGVTTAAVAGPTIKFNDRPVDQNACKGAAVTLTYSVS